MKNIFYYLTVVLLMVASVSCDLDKYPYDAIEQSQAFKTLSDAGTIRNGLYGNMRSRLHGIYMFSTDVQADLLNATLDFGNRNGFPHRWEGFLDTDYTIRDVWRGYYSALVNVNNAIAMLPSIETANDTEKATLDSYIGEAYFLRAYYYHQLVLRWGKAYDPTSAASDLGVPLVLTFDVTAKPARATVDEVYKQILSDLTEAKTKLSGVAGSPGSNRITIDAVTALQARIHLHMRNWTEAATAAKSLITGGKYPLVKSEADFRKIWVNDAGSELIFQLQLVAPQELSPSGDPWNNVNNIFLGFQPSTGKYVPDFVPQQWVIDLYENTDFRKNVYLAKKPLYIQGTDYPDIYLINKYPGNPALFTGATTNYQHKPKVLRIAEMYLIAAEADAQSTGGESAALTLLNQLRQARGAKELAGLSGAALMNEIRNERTRELLCEGFRLDDLRRWNLGFTRKTPQNLNLINVTPSADYHQKTVQAGDLKFTWGLPANDLTTNPNLVQNQGW